MAMTTPRKPVPILDGENALPPAATPEQEPATVDAPSAPPEAEAPTEPVEAVEVRVLLAFEGHRPNDVVAVAGDHLDRLRSTGLVDDHPVAVAYARSLRA
jgi:hypothetical protein